MITEINDQCDPNEFYKNSTDVDMHFDLLDDIEPIISYITLAVVIIFSPILIISPFVIADLSSLTRKVIAMVVLADFINTLGGALEDLNDKTWRQFTDEANHICLAVVYVADTSNIWSITWSVLCFLNFRSIYVLITLRK